MFGAIPLNGAIKWESIESLQLMRVVQLSCENDEICHGQIVGTFSVKFTSQFRRTGKHKQPDQAFRPCPHPANPAMAALIQMRPVLGHLWPTIILEVGNKQGVLQLVDIRQSKSSKCGLGLKIVLRKM